MFVRYNIHEQNVPIKIWLKGLEDIEEGALEQAENVSNLPFIHKHVALMPDCHMGYGVPIGCVMATKGVIIPNAVGVDIGCGMAFVQTNIHKSELTEIDYRELTGQIMRNVPTGFSKHKDKEGSLVLFSLQNHIKNVTKGRPTTELENMLLQEIDNGYYQVGTLGGGNHFIEIQEDENGYICIMLHSGSRHFGYAVAKYFNDLAKKKNEDWYSIVPSKHDLAFLPTDTEEGKMYIHLMQVALDFAQENRQKMLEVVKKELVKKYRGTNVEFTNEVNVHHNYASLENHFGQNVWVHRKGAIRVRQGELGIIPSAMGGVSYVVRGKGNKDSFHSASHGAGRKMSRKQAREHFSTQETMENLKSRGVILGKTNKSDVADESIWAYKDIDEVLDNEQDLVEVVKELKTICVIKG